MPLPESEEVDAFGRAINRSRRFDASRSDLERGNARGGIMHRGRIDARGRGRSRSRSPPGRRDARGFMAGDVGSTAADRGAFHDTYHRQQLPPPHPPLPPSFYDGPEQVPLLEPPSTSLLPPLASYKSFIMTQPEGLSPDVYQKMYEQYHLSYLEEFSEAFFRVSMSEEWFQDRYNPINIVNLEQETAEWAIKESLVIKKALEKHGNAFVQACSLEPSANVRPASHRHSHSANKQQALPAAQGAENEADEEGESVVAGRQLDGHAQRTVYIPGVHACCPKAVFRGAVISALGATGEEAPDSAMLPDRILVSHPVWSPRALERFERSAWVVFPSIRAARRGLEVLKGLQVKVPGPADAKGEPTVAFQFTVQAMMHSPRPAHVLPEFMSSGPRLRADLARALEIASLLDAERNLPGDQRLQSLLATAGPLSIVQRLDVAVAYLRRTHLVAYYSGKRYRDEAHMLAQAPSPTFRAVAAPEELLAPQAVDSDLAGLEAVHASLSTADRETETGGETEREAAGGERAAEEEEEEEEAADGEREERDDEDERPRGGEARRQSGAAVASSGAPSSSSSSSVPTNDRRIDALLKALQSPATPSVDQSDAADLKALLENTFEGLVRARCKFEEDGKCRCCFEHCKKLFKAYDFLAKHMRGKHPEFGLELSLRHAEGYMRRRYLAEPLPARPLPPVEVEGPFGRVEYRSVAEVLQRATAHSAGALASHGREMGGGVGGGRGGDRWSGADHRGADRDHRGDRRGGGHERGYGRGGDDEHYRRGGGGGHAMRNSPPVPPPPPPLQPPSHPTSAMSGTFQVAGGVGTKRMPTYLDVDVPKESVVSVDYGVSIAPPVKRRRVVAAAAPSAPTLASGVGAASEAVPTTTSLT